jgi:hypothetical protein
MVAAGQIRVPLALVAEENDRSVRKAGDNSMRSSAAAQVSDVSGDKSGDKKDENLHPF